MLELEKRKNTTRKALLEAEKALKVIENEMESDLFNFSSIDFNIICNTDNGLFPNDYNYREWTEDTAYLGYRSGYIKIYCYPSETDRNYSNRRDMTELDKVNFRQLSEAINDLIEKYNKKSIEKEREINDFLTKTQEILSEK